MEYRAEHDVATEQQEGSYSRDNQSNKIVEEVELDDRSVSVGSVQLRSSGHSIRPFVLVRIAEGLQDTTGSKAEEAREHTAKGTRRLRMVAEEYQLYPSVHE